jgi:hypothetical protein
MPAAGVAIALLLSLYKWTIDNMSKQKLDQKASVYKRI